MTKHAKPGREELVPMMKFGPDAPLEAPGRRCTGRGGHKKKSMEPVGKRKLG